MTEGAIANHLPKFLPVALQAASVWRIRIAIPHGWTTAPRSFLIAQKIQGGVSYDGA
jgi:hypothetical protein